VQKFFEHFGFLFNEQLGRRSVRSGWGRDVCFGGTRPYAKQETLVSKIIIMPTQESAALQDQLKLILRINDTRPANDPFKLPSFLLADATSDLAALVDTDEDTAPAEGDRATASNRRRRALTELERQLGGGQRFLTRSPKTNARRLSKPTAGRAARSARCWMTMIGC
jgi:hypothetical protein